MDKSKTADVAKKEVAASAADSKLKKDEAKKDDSKKAEVKIPTGPSLEDLALLQTPTVAEQQAKDAKKKPEVTTTTQTASVEKKDDVTTSNRLEEIAAQQQIIAQAQQNSYRVDSQVGPQSLYHPNSAVNNPAVTYRPSNSGVPYIANKEQQQLPQRGGVVTQYDHADLTRTVGRSAADELRDRLDTRVTGDKGLQRMYNRNKDF